MTRLRTCQACFRHVFETEIACPFCQQTLTQLPAAAPVATPPGLSRAQRLALVAALAGSAAPVLAGCGSDEPSGSDGGSVAVPVYGAPVSGSAAVPPAAGSGKGGTAASGGAGVSGHAGSSGSAGAAGKAQSGSGGSSGTAGSKPGVGQPPVAGKPGSDDDAGVADGGPMVHPLYGAPIPAYGAPPQP
jgi:hypothetical protein